MPMTSPFFSVCRLTSWPLTCVPLVLCRSSRMKLSASRKMRAWWLDTAGLSIRMVLSGTRPIFTTCAPTGTSFSTRSSYFRINLAIAPSSESSSQPVPHLLPESSGNVHHHHRDVVRAAVAIGGFDQIVANPLRVAQRVNGARQARVGHHAGQAVAAQQQVVARAQRHFGDVHLHRGLLSQSAQQDAALLRFLHLVAPQQPRFHLGLDQRVVFGDRLQLLLVPEVSPAVTHVG